jgi:large subunit ribosomal protein L23
MVFNPFKKKNEQPKRQKAEKVVEQEQVQDTPGIPVAVGSSVLKSFRVSEKSARGQAYNQYTFVIADKATKTDVKHAVQRAFKVNVVDVSITRLPSKHRAIGRYQGTTPGVKKAVVTLKGGQIIAQAQP